MSIVTLGPRKSKKCDSLLDCMACAHPGGQCQCCKKSRMDVLRIRNLPVDWYMGIDSESLDRCVSYSERLPPMKTPISRPTADCLGMPAFSNASNVHSNNSRCWGSTIECKDGQALVIQEEFGSHSLEMASFSVNEKNGASNSAGSSFRK